MKLQLDTENKTIKLEEKIKFEDLIKTLDVLFPSKAWMKYTLETTTNITNWTQPYLVQPYIHPDPFIPSPWSPYPYNHNDQILCGNGETTNSIITSGNTEYSTLTNTIHNLEIDLTQK